MKRCIVKSDQLYGRLTTLAKTKAGKGRGTYTHWICKCDCGRLTAIRPAHLVRFEARSCGHCHLDPIMGRRDLLRLEEDCV